jgi:hypothetical protein
VGIDTRNHDGDFALTLIAKGTGYFGHGGRNRIRRKGSLLNKRAQRYNKPNAHGWKNGAVAERLR